MIALAGLITLLAVALVHPLLIFGLGLLLVGVFGGAMLVWKD